MKSLAKDPLDLQLSNVDSWQPAVHVNTPSPQAIAPGFSGFNAFQPHIESGTASSPIYLDNTLPFAVGAAPGSDVSLSSILDKTFGANMGGYSGAWIAYYGTAQLSSWDFSYWDPTHAQVAKWLVNGTDIGPDFSNQQFVSSSQIGTAQLQAGNDIGDLAYIMVATAFDSGGHAVAYDQLSVITVDPSLIAPNAGDGDPTPADIVASAERFAHLYSGVPNDNDCHKIACAVSAAAGAAFNDDTTYSLDPSQNQSQGFWRVVYRGSQANPVSNWQTLVKPGDIVRMGWTGGGQHTTTVLAVNANGSIKVFDNDAFQGATEIIGIHNVNYDQDTIPTTITIYRLSPDHLYLIEGSSASERLVGTSFNDQIDGLNGNDTLVGNTGNDVLNGGGGNDNLQGGTGNDTLSGNAGNDTIDGGSGNDKILPGTGADTVTGGSGNDLIDFTGGKLIGADKINGGGGLDTVQLAGLDYTGTSKIIMTATTMVGVETLKLAAGHNYDITTANATVAAGQTLTVNGAALASSAHLTFNGAAETDGHFKFEGGKGSDTLTGGHLSDTFVYTSAAGSTGTAYDTINAFNFSNDRIDVAGTIGKIDAHVNHSISTASFNTDIAGAASSSHLAAHSAMLVTATAGTLNHDVFLVVDLNGVAGYQANADLVIHMNAATGALATSDFI